MIVKTVQEWDARMADTTKFFFVTLRTGQRKEDIHSAAERQAQREDAREALWVQDTAILSSSQPDLKDIINNHPEVTAVSICFSRHIVRKYKDADLPESVLDTRIDEAFFDASQHD